MVNVFPVSLLYKSRFGHSSTRGVSHGSMLLCFCGRVEFLVFFFVVCWPWFRVMVMVVMVMVVIMISDSDIQRMEPLELHSHFIKDYLRPKYLTRTLSLEAGAAPKTTVHVPFDMEPCIFVRVGGGLTPRDPIQDRFGLQEHHRIHLVHLKKVRRHCIISIGGEKIGGGFKLEPCGGDLFVSNHRFNDSARADLQTTRIFKTSASIELNRGTRDFIRACNLGGVWSRRLNPRASRWILHPR